MRGARLVLAVSLMVGWASTAAAEGAWVLWHHIGLATSRHDEPHYWRVRGAAPSYQKCEDLRVSRIRADAPGHAAEIAEIQESLLRSLGRKDLGETRLSEEEIERGAQARITEPAPEWGYVCLPDTLDPRERKD